MMALASVNKTVNAKPRYSRVIALIIVLIFLSGTNVYSIVSGSGVNTAVIRLLTLLPILAILYIYFGNFARGAFVAPELIALLLLATISLYWSIDRSITIKHLVPFLTTTSLMIMVASMLSLRSLFIMFGHIAAFTMYGSLIAVVLFSSARGAPPWDDVWIGVFGHKNGLGAASVTAILVAMPAAMLSTGKKKAYFMLAAVIGLLLMVITQSRSAQLFGLYLFCYWRPGWP